MLTKLTMKINRYLDSIFEVFLASIFRPVAKTKSKLDRNISAL